MDSHSMGTNNLCLMTGNANPELAKKIAEHMGVEIFDTFVGRFNNGETARIFSSFSRLRNPSTII